jgi:ArsR family transcriptional regulator
MPKTSNLDIARLQQAAAEAATLLKALANEERLLLLCQLSQGEYAVGELEALLGIFQPTLSQQLGVLRNQGLVATRRDGKQIYYRLDDPQALALLQTLYAVYCGKKRGGSHAD